ncbi:MAG: hypothetical protein PHR43_03325 [Dehalococcoidales bacterium]|nr:hypothetical protein [Dehalococcoidales bacterium]
MPGKSRRGKGKRVAQSRKAMLRPAMPPAEAASDMTEMAAADSVAPVKRPAAHAQALRYPYVSVEIRTIGLFAILILVILIVLALIFS